MRRFERAEKERPAAERDVAESQLTPRDYRTALTTQLGSINSLHVVVKENVL
jgi:hypothetical protein